MDLRRLKNVIEESPAAVAAIIDETAGGVRPFSKLTAYWDILKCAVKYRMLCSEYMSERMYGLSAAEKRCVGEAYNRKGIIKDAWQRDFQKNRRFFAKWSKPVYDIGVFRLLRQRAYSRRYNAGIDLKLENNVFISRHHFLAGNISIGKHVYLARNTSIDYSGGLEIKDNARITNGVIIETHSHLYHSDWRKDFSDIESHGLVVEEGAILGVRSVVLSTCHYIGKYARVGAGAVVTKDVPDYSIVAGVPARIIRIMEHEE